MTAPHTARTTPRARPIHVFLLDEQPIARAGAEVSLAPHDSIRVVGNAASVDEALLQAPRNCDVVVMDVRPIAESTRRLRGRLPDTRIVVFTGEESQASIRRALSAGANGFVSKTATGGELAHAIETVGAGNGYYRPRIPLGDSDGCSQESRLALLTRREREVLVEVGEGRTSKEIAHRFGLSIRTVETHRDRVMQKLGIHTASGLTRFAIARGLVDAV